MEPLPDRLRKMSRSELDKELMSKEYNESGRAIILSEISSRDARELALEAKRLASRANLIAMIAIIIAAIASITDIKWSILCLLDKLF